MRLTIISCGTPLYLVIAADRSASRSSFIASVNLIIIVSCRRLLYNRRLAYGGLLTLHSLLSRQKRVRDISECVIRKLSQFYSTFHIVIILYSTAYLLYIYTWMLIDSADTKESSETSELELELEPSFSKATKLSYSHCRSGSSTGSYTYCQSGLTGPLGYHFDRSLASNPSRIVSGIVPRIPSCSSLSCFNLASTSGSGIGIVRYAAPRLYTVTF
jgi:hypothetical protein